MIKKKKNNKIKLINMVKNVSNDLSKNQSNVMIDLIKYPVINYKSYRMLIENKQYMFDVDLRLSKPQIQKLFEDYFKVKVISVNTHRPPRQKSLATGFPGYKTRLKRVIIKLQNDQSLTYVDELMSGFIKQLMQRSNNVTQTTQTDETNN
uniref:Large ribosomal subunit protein uL23c n=1 Tax=Oedocladium carolinianum TaxID=55992 RepID=A0A1D8GX89_9CHLO|nr:ribosomal protein L23 [Oedocladium carolinianum]AOT84319.1 ribosomal protein L23 [Oedocladium carolinianum]